MKINLKNQINSAKGPKEGENKRWKKFVASLFFLFLFFAACATWTRVAGTGGRAKSSNNNSSSLGFLSMNCVSYCNSKSERERERDRGATCQQNVKLARKTNKRKQDGGLLASFRLACRFNVRAEK